MEVAQNSSADLQRAVVPPRCTGSLPIRDRAAADSAIVGTQAHHLEETGFTTAGTLMPTSSMSTLIAMWGAFLALREVVDQRLCADVVWNVITRANPPPESG